MTDRSADAVESGLLLWMAEQRAQSGKHVEPGDVADMMAARRDQPLPGWLHDLACAHLRGEAKRPRGRPFTEEDDWQPDFLEIARSDYDELRARLKIRAERPANSERKCRLYHPPHEVALELVLRRHQRSGRFKHIGLKHFRYLISSS